jgi:predicted F0F1-ATPase subunit
MNRISNSQSTKPLPKLMEREPRSMPQLELEPDMQPDLHSEMAPDREHHNDQAQILQAQTLRRPGKFRLELPGWPMIRATSMLAMVVAVPTALGMATGVWIDTLWPNTQSWFSILAPVGFALGCLCAVFWSYLDPQQ